MRVTLQKTLRKFWYATVRVDALADGPKPFRLLGEDIVVFLDSKGEPAALRDRCCHRSAKLSKGWIDGDQLVCGYHGWGFDREGRVVRIPQLPADVEIGTHVIPRHHAKSAYGYVWVALDDPIGDIPPVPEDSDPGFRRIFQFYDTWNTSSIRLMENSFDNAHFSFVHKSTFGQINQPKPEKYEIVETDFGFEAETIITIVNPPRAHRVTGTTDDLTKRHMRNKWYMPFCRRLDIEYPSGLRHIIINSATPIDDGSIQLVQLLFRNDTEADCSTEELIAWDKEIITEDRDILESTDPSPIIDMSKRAESHMPSDRPGIIMRKRLTKLFEEQGEAEAV